VTPTTEDPQIKNEPKANPVIDTAAGPNTDAKEDLKPNEQPKSKDDLKSIPMADLQAKLQSSPKGLTQAEAAKRLAQNGPNALKEVKVNAFLKFLSYFWGPIPWMIEASVILSGVVRHWLDFIIISVLLFSNAVVGFWEEHQAGNAIAALKAKLANDARALRDGKWATPKASELVTGDVIRLRLGDIVPADARLLDGDPVEVDQSALTGESLPVSRKPGDAVFSGSIMRQGEIDAMVYATGEDRLFFLEVEPTDASDFQQTLCIDGCMLGENRLLHGKSPVVANSIAAFLMHLEQHTGKIPHAYFKWKEGNPVANILRFIFLGEGDTAPLTHEVLRRAIPNPKHRPIVHVS
jgi:H+-transporting ATPase